MVPMVLWLARRWLLLLATLALLLGGARAVRDAQVLVSPRPEDSPFFDYRIMTSRMREAEATGRLYDTGKPDAFDPRSTSMFKYPPLHAVLLRLVVGTSPERFGPKIGQGKVGRIWIPLVVCLALSAAAAWRALRPDPLRAVLGLAVMMWWYPNFESLRGPQLEPLFLLLFCLALWGLRRGSPGWAGAAIGVAGAFKVYPWLVLPYALARRRWRLLAGACAGVAATLALGMAFYPPRDTIEYFTRILPRQGGVGMTLENVGAAGRLLHIAYAATKTEMPYTVKIASLLAGGPAANPVPFTAAIVFVALAAAMALITVRRTRRPGRMGQETREMLHLGISLALVLSLLPSSWMNYQSLLLLPIWACLVLAAPPRNDLLAWGILLGCAVVGSIASGSCPLALVESRALLAPLLWGLQLRMLSQTDSFSPVTK
jgi:hypothetical protein